MLNLEYGGVSIVVLGYCDIHMLNLGYFGVPMEVLGVLWSPNGGSGVL